MTTYLTIFAVVSICIFLNALYVAAEFATVSSRRTRISQMAGQGNKMAKLLYPIVEDRQKLDNYVATCQVGITISSLVVGAYGQNVIAALLVEPVSELLAILQPLLASLGMANTALLAVGLAETISLIVVLAFITTLQVVMGELFPKSVAIQHPEELATSSFILLPMLASRFVFTPLIFLFNGSGALLLKLLGREMRKEVLVHSAEEIELLVTESHQSGLLDDEERRMLRNAFRLRDLAARQVMMHRTKIEAAQVNTAVPDLLKLAIAAGYSRIPLYKETVDDIVGFVHIKDVFRLHVQGQTDVKTILREVAYVPETMPVIELWELLNTRRKYVAIVFDEYGGTAGLITFEDLIEEIFGELQDEFDDDEAAPYSRDKEGRIYLRGDLLVDDVNEYWGLNLPSESADTLSGLIFSRLERKPQVGDDVIFDNIIMHVETIEDQAVSEVSMTIPTSDLGDPFIEWEVVDHD